MPPSLSELRKRVEAAAPIDIELRFKPMFGGIGVYANGRMCISLSNAGLALKLGPADGAALLKLKGAKPLQYEPDSPPSKSYVVTPASMVSDRMELGRWIARSARFTATASPARSKRRSSQPERGNRDRTAGAR